ncbi:hypothetical protein [Novipirellula aureliae]|uniref:hypothetical protein n=1 Tax=Novipirellula aureliae TaxID=2527966 RepID=UPI0018CF7C15|nr:hypothetical protein [Novipirellula aureliae]
MSAAASAKKAARQWPVDVNGHGPRHSWMLMDEEANSHVMKHAIRHIDCVESEVIPKEFDMIFARTDAVCFPKSFYIIG